MLCPQKDWKPIIDEVSSQDQGSSPGLDLIVSGGGLDLGLGIQESLSHNDLRGPVANATAVKFYNQNSYNFGQVYVRIACGGLIPRRMVKL
jgi:hypothetical protein